MNRYRAAAIIGAGMMLVTGPATAGLINVAGPQTIRPHASVEQIYYRNNAAVPEAIIGGIMSGVIGGALGGSCYYNDCGYGDGYYGGGGIWRRRWWLSRRTRRRWSYRRWSYRRWWSCPRRRRWTRQALATRSACHRALVHEWPMARDGRDPRSNPIPALFIPALELHMQYLNVSAFVVASAILVAGFGPARAEGRAAVGL